MTPEELKAKADAEKAEFEKRVAMFQSLAGKSFKRKDGRGDVVRVLGYDGVKSHIENQDGKPVTVNSHTLKTENGWTPPATKFMAEYEEVTAVETQTTEEVV